ncbi:phosphate ABC transporter ATP-binding protein [Candidatus Viridilinea mediisalina]|uniref:Phosphate ABC transporter ATP-binding protein n=1 Tax=Candidatus Viridilinea mediisalina TaxID=2024553 RepID=A0A2A6RNG6_9CHLR|nr:phosphate ABC transporter ATP-binding protein [Candidatus Viridilinea mediisalina]PDW04455.1 phosphate ABC transporter ATP-binding protein [Candidatus Viridilinea mediisalina]
MPGIAIRKLNIWYGNTHALREINLDLPDGQITAIIGPSGCGKSTLLKSINRLLDLNEHVRITGQILIDGAAIYGKQVDVTEVRTQVGMLAQKPFPLPMSIYDNVAYGPRIHGLARGRQLAQLVTDSLKAARLWDEVGHRLKESAHKLSVGQQQRLCLARALAIQPAVLLCDESTASLDPIAARGIEELLSSLRQRYTLVMVTHDIEQARRLADYVVFMWLGEVVEHGPAAAFFQHPQHSLSQAYLAREIG